MAISAGSLNAIATSASRMRSIAEALPAAADIPALSDELYQLAGSTAAEAQRFRWVDTCAPVADAIANSALGVAWTSGAIRHFPTVHATTAAVHIGDYAKHIEACVDQARKGKQFLAREVKAPAGPPQLVGDAPAGQLQLGNRPRAADMVDAGIERIYTMPDGTTITAPRVRQRVSFDELPTRVDAAYGNGLHVGLSKVSLSDQPTASTIAPKASAAERAPETATAASEHARQPPEPAAFQREFPELAKYSEDLTARAAEGKLRGAVGRDAELRAITTVLRADTNNNPLLVGLPGTGKTALFEELAIRVANGDVPEHMQGRHVVLLDLAALTAGTRNRGDFEERFKAVTDEILASDRGVLLLVDEAHNLVSAGSAKDIPGAGEALKPLLGRGKLQLVGATTIDEAAIIEKDPALGSRFTQVPIHPLDDLGVLRVLRRRAIDSAPPGTNVTDAALKEMRDLSTRYLRVDLYQPRAAVKVLENVLATIESARSDVPAEISTLRGGVSDLSDELAIVARERSSASQHRARAIETELPVARAKLERAEKAVQQARALAAGEHPNDMDDDAAATLRARFPDMFVTEIDVPHAQAAVARMADLPLGTVSADEAQRLAGFEDRLNTHVLGQEGAMRPLAQAIISSRAGFKDPSLPVFAGIAYGPPGTGKTQTAKALAHELHGTEKALVRLDMSTIGQNGGEPVEQLANALRRRPGSVVLVDEIEKAPAEMFDGLLTALGEGYITNRAGKQIPTSDAAFVLTSNLKSPEAIEAFFAKRPELLDRMDALLPYSSPVAEHAVTLAQREVAALTTRVQASRGVELLVDPDIATSLAQRAIDDPKVGVRLLKRMVVKSISNAASPTLLGAKRGDQVHVSTSPDGTLIAR